MRLAARYRAAGEGNEVGGDFYDVFQVGRSAWTIVLGDVSGKGPEAAAIAGLARHTLRAVAMRQRTPRRLLVALHDTLAHGEGNGEFCTVCCALLQPSPSRPGGARLTVASAGHPPPVIRRADGTTELIDTSGPILGLPMRSMTFKQHALDLDVGDTVVMYTDGVTEAHHHLQELFGEERLLETIRMAPGDVDAIADAILAAVSAHGPDDPTRRCCRGRAAHGGRTERMSDWEPAFERTEGEVETVLVVRGEIDLSVAARFAQELEALTHTAGTPAAVDLEGVVFIDSAGVRELVKAQHRPRDRGTDLVLRNPSAACRRVLQLSGLWDEFTVAGGV